MIFPVIKDDDKTVDKMVPSKFKYVPNNNKRRKLINANQNGYYQCQIYLKNQNWTFIVPNLNYLTSRNLDCHRYIKEPNKFLNSLIGDKNQDGSVSGKYEIEEKENLFQHGEEAICFLAALCNAGSELGFIDDAQKPYKEQKYKLCQNADNLFQKMMTATSRYYKRIQLKRMSKIMKQNERGVCLVPSEYLINIIDDKWPLLVQLVGSNGSETHYVCISNGAIYDANFKNAIEKSINGLDWCAKLGVEKTNIKCLGAKRVYRMLPKNMPLKKKTPLYTHLPEKENWEY